MLLRTHVYKLMLKFAKLIFVLSFQLNENIMAARTGILVLFLVIAAILCIMQGNFELYFISGKEKWGPG